MTSATPELWLPSQPLGHWCHTTGTKLYWCDGGSRHVCEQLAQGRYLAVEWLKVELATSLSCKPTTSPLHHH